MPRKHRKRNNKRHKPEPEVKQEGLSRFQAIALILLTSLFCLPCLQCKLLDSWDDRYVLTQNTFVQNPSNFFKLFTKEYFDNSRGMGLPAAGEETYRPVATFTYGLDYWLWGQHLDFGTHLHNFILHLLTAVLFFVILEKLHLGRLPSLLCACLYVVHPVNVEVVCNVSYREDLLCALFFVCAFISHINYMRKGTYRWLIASLIALALSLFSKEMATPFIAIAAIHNFVRYPKVSRVRHTTALGLQAILTLSYLYIYVTLSKDANSILKSSGQADLLEQAGLLFSTPAVHTRMLFTSFPLKAVHEYQFAVFDLLCYLGFLGALAYLAIGKHGNKQTFVWLACYLIAMTPVMNILPVNHPVADRYLYLPGLLAIPGIVILLIDLLKRKQMQKWGIALSICCILFFGVRTTLRAMVWKNDVTFSKQLIKETPHSSRSWITYGTVMAQRQNFSEAERGFLKAKEIAPGSVRVYMNLAALYQNTKRFDEALKIYEEIIPLAPNFHPDAYYAMGQIHRQTGKFKQAASAFEKAIEINPNFFLARSQLATLLIKQKLYREAVVELEKIISIAPNHWESVAFLGLVYIELKEIEKAKHWLTEFVNNAPPNHRLQANCKMALIELSED